MTRNNNISAKVSESIALRGELVAELQGLLNDAEAEDRALTASEQQRFDQLKRAIGQGDTHIENLRTAANIAARSATRIGPARDHPPLAKGVAAARMVQLLVASKGSDLQGVALAQRHFPDTPELAQVFQARANGLLQRAAVPPAVTNDPTGQWAGGLCTPTNSALS